LPGLKKRPDRLQMVGLSSIKSQKSTTKVQQKNVAIASESTTGILSPWQKLH